MMGRDACGGQRLDCKTKGKLVDVILFCSQVEGLSLNASLMNQRINGVVQLKCFRLSACVLSQTLGWCVFWNMIPVSVS